MIDGITIAEHCCVVALAITADGTKLPVGLWLGDTENNHRGDPSAPICLPTSTTGAWTPRVGLLVVIDGAEALHHAVHKVLGEAALIQHCTIHKHRNVTDHLPEIERGRVDATLARAFNHPNPDIGCAPPATCPALHARHPGRR